MTSREAVARIIAEEALGHPFNLLKSGAKARCIQAADAVLEFMVPELLKVVRERLTE